MMFPAQGTAPQGTPAPQPDDGQQSQNPIMQVVGLARQLNQLAPGVHPKILKEQFGALGAAADAGYKVKRAMRPSKEEKKAQQVPPSLQPPKPRPQVPQRPGMPGMPPSLAAMLQSGLR